MAWLGVQTTLSNFNGGEMGDGWEGGGGECTRMLLEPIARCPYKDRRKCFGKSLCTSCIIGKSHI